MSIIARVSPRACLAHEAEFRAGLRLDLGGLEGVQEVGWLVGKGRGRGEVSTGTQNPE